MKPTATEPDKPASSEIAHGQASVLCPALIKRAELPVAAAAGGDR